MLAQHQTHQPSSLPRHLPGVARSVLLERVHREPDPTPRPVAELLPLPLRTVERAVTRDGVFLALERRARPGARPVLLLHGWAQSSRGWDPEVRGHSLARYLSRAGFDVWNACFRGHGEGMDGSGWSGPWSVEDLAALDLAALVDRVRARTSRSPALVGHSMGALASFMYLAGAVVEDGEVVADREEALLRNTLVDRVVAVAPPLSFPGKGVALLSARPDLAGRLACRFGASRLGELLLGSLPRVSLRQLASGVRSIPWVGGVLRRLATDALLSGAARAFWAPENMTPELAEAELWGTLDATSGAELRQFARWAVRGELAEAGGTDWSRELSSVTAPTLLVSGGQDPTASVESITRDGLGRLGSVDLRMLMVDDAGHNDLRVGRRAVEEVFPAIGEWLVS